MKFDLRIFVLLVGIDPLRIYIYNDGLARFATERYERPDADNIDNLFMHLTNYAINKKHKEFKQNLDEEEEGESHKWSLKALWNYM